VSRQRCTPPPLWLCVSFAGLLASSVTAATKSGDPPPDKEMLRMLELLREMELIKQMDMLRDMHHLENAAEQARTGQESAAGKKKGVVK
jgi:hypothetical protein